MPVDLSVLSISDDVSPVNAFRMILREYIGQQLENLPTRTLIYLNRSAIWQFLDVQDDLTAKKQ